MTALQERIQACEQLHYQAATPTECLAYFYELQGLLGGGGDGRAADLDGCGVRGGL